ncbi:MAG: hypothetical protein H6713_13540 [Myxococcales bacterium]|nr:hypothetical protein [Myxococcales bacterium]
MSALASALLGLGLSRAEALELAPAQPPAQPPASAPAQPPEPPPDLQLEAPPEPPVEPSAAPTRAPEPGPQPSPPTVAPAPPQPTAPPRPAVVQGGAPLDPETGAPLPSATPRPAPSASPQPRREPQRYGWGGRELNGRVAFSVLPAVTFGISYAPSQELPLYLGFVLPASRPDRRWTLGYQVTGSAGLADRFHDGRLTHRHHLMATRVGGDAAPRRYLSIGAGAAFLLDLSPVVEVEARFGFAFGRAPVGRLLGLFGLMTRVGWSVGKGELAPMPQFGLFLGCLMGPTRRGR